MSETGATIADNVTEGTNAAQNATTSASTKNLVNVNAEKLTEGTDTSTVTRNTRTEPPFVEYKQEGTNVPKVERKE